jgi:hypothetical protein
MHGGEVVVTRNGKRAAARLTPYITEIERYFIGEGEGAGLHLHGGKKVSYEEFMGIYEKSELRMEYINGEIVLPEPAGHLSTRMFPEIYAYSSARLPGRIKSARYSTRPLMSIFRKKVSQDCPT